MHELSVTEGILKICLDEGKKHNIEKIKKINIVVGELTGLCQIVYHIILILLLKEL